MSTDATIYDMIMSFGVDEMAEFLHEICRERDLKLQEALHRQGVEADLVELPREVQIEMHKQFLLTPYDCMEN